MPKRPANSDGLTKWIALKISPTLRKTLDEVAAENNMSINSLIRHQLEVVNGVRMSRTQRTTRPNKEAGS